MDAEDASGEGCDDCRRMKAKVKMSSSSSLSLRRKLGVPLGLPGSGS
jgi:hypothetical protein